MSRWTLSLGLALSFVFACERGSAEPSKPAPKPEAQPAAQAEDQPEQRPEAEAAPASDSERPKPESESESESVPTTLEASALEPGVEPPTNKVLTKLAAELQLRNAVIAAKPVGFGPRTYVTALRSRDGDPAHFTLQIFVVHLPEGEDATWSRAPGMAYQVREWKDEGWSDKPGAIPTTLIVEDLDADGEAEILVRFRYEEMLGGGGLNTSTDMLILNVSERGIEEAIRANLHHLVTVFESKGKATFEDDDGDGHPDLQIRKREYEDDTQTETRESRWLWDPTSDRYVPKPA